MPLAITADEARAFLRERGHEADGVTPLSGGLWSATFAFREAGREYVVRFHERRDDLEKDRFAERWRTSSLRIPHMVEIGDVPAGGGYGIAERVIGKPIDERDDDGMRKILPSLFAALEATRGADLAGTAGWGLWHGDGNAVYGTWEDNLLREDPPGERAAQRELLAATRIGSAEFDAGLARMRELVPFAQMQRSLVHNDLLNYNLLADDAGVILLDWGASIYGDFLYDSALLTFWWPYYAKWAGIDIRAEVERHFGDAPNFRERLRLCELDIGVSHIAFQASQARWDNAAWTAKRTAERARAPI